MPQSIAETIAKHKGDTSYWEDRLRKLIVEFEKSIEEIKAEAKNKIEDIIQNALFGVIDSSAKELAKQTAKEEIKQFKLEVNQKVANILASIEKIRQDIFTKVNSQIENSYYEFMQEVKKLLEATTKETSIIFEKFEDKFTEIENELKEKVETLQGPEGKEGISGKDADPEITANIVLSKIPKAEELTAEIIVNKISSLPNEKKIEISAIKGLNEWLQNLARAIKEKTRPQQVMGGGGMGNVQHQVFSVSSATTTIATTYAIAGGGFACWLFYQGQQIHRGTHYTVGSDRKILTLTFTCEDNTTITAIYVRG